MPRGDVAGSLVVWISRLVDKPLRPEIEGGVKVRDTVEQDTGLVGAGSVAGGHISGREIADAPEDRLFPLAINQIRANEPPTVLSLAVAFAVVHPKMVKRIAGLGMVGVEKERSIGPFRVEYPVCIQAGEIKFPEIIFWKQFATMGTAHFPRPFEWGRLPFVHWHALFARGTMTVRPDHPGTRNGA